MPHAEARRPRGDGGAEDRLGQKPGRAPMHGSVIEDSMVAETAGLHELRLRPGPRERPGIVDRNPAVSAIVQDQSRDSAEERAGE
jgi:hypothetical protein